MAADCQEAIPGRIFGLFHVADRMLAGCPSVVFLLVRFGKDKSEERRRETDRPREQPERGITAEDSPQHRQSEEELAIEFLAEGHLLFGREAGQIVLAGGDLGRIGKKLLLS